ncbi:hypothetical protein [Pelagicoccus mobilis]|uniref:Tryptophan synthase beta chain-like PALP domain-containing protein n=1 Tax=Pelagicoccus mobilis TaxID=415221 RepID=A0A934RV84_9BACT|nr:hypothetical protein [Pelagicoccus mobilis]MBK1877018.1 hypothetical protein [Pelagicoccus mobilis]
MEQPFLKPPTLPQSVSSKIDYSLVKSTRSYVLCKSQESEIWIKREDELSAGVAGSKLRKYSSLVPYFKEKGIKVVGLIGGPNSNNLVGLSQLLKENDIQPIAFIREAADKTLRGNSLLLDMLLSEKEKISISRDAWDSASSIAEKHLSKSGLPFFLLPEGAFVPEALPGGLTLAESVLDNEIQNGVFFDRIYIDCGTGLTAIALILGLEFLAPQIAKSRTLVVTLIAGNEATFKEKLTQTRKTLNMGSQISTEPSCTIEFRRPALSPKFGSISKSLIKSCREIARNHGLLMDPTYSVKHFQSMIEDSQSLTEKSRCLFIFNGSPLGLMGFQSLLGT